LAGKCGDMMGGIFNVGVYAKNANAVVPNLEDGDGAPEEMINF
jgi:hypothetical protein